MAARQRNKQRRGQMEAEKAAALNAALPAWRMEETLADVPPRACEQRAPTGDSLKARAASAPP